MLEQTGARQFRSRLIAEGGGVTVDGNELNVGEVMSYKGVMMSSIPNFAMVFGYTNASWTLKADLAAEFVCRVINHMDKNGYSRVVPNAEGVQADDTPMFDLEAGYMKRAADRLPKQGPEAPWTVVNNYLADRPVLKKGKLEDGVLEFAKAGSGTAKKTSSRKAPAKQAA